MTRAQMILARFNGRAFSLARTFGRGRLFASWLQLRFVLTGRTGPYRVRLDAHRVRLAHVIRQAIRGCGTLPYFGSHPGLAWLAIFLVYGTAAGGGAGGFTGALIAGALTALWSVPLFMVGAYLRAEESDALVAQEGAARG